MIDGRLQASSGGKELLTVVELHQIAADGSPRHDIHLQLHAASESLVN